MSDGDGASPEEPQAASDAEPEAGPLERLLAIQDQDTVLDQLAHRRAHLPERAAREAHTAVVAEVEADRAAKAARREELAATLRRLQGEVASLEARIAELTRTLHSGAVTVPRELQALQHEQDSLRRRQDHLETEELELMEELDPLDEELAGLVGRLEELAAEGGRLDDELLGAEIRVEEEITVATDRREAAREGVDDDLLATYEGLRSRLEGVAVARLVGGVCGGCHLGLSAAEVARIKKQPPDALVTCDECGRLLVR